MNVREYCQQNTELELQDVFKFLFQSCMGCEHLVSDYAYALERIDGEMKDAKSDDLPDVEYLDGNYCRVHLKVLKDREAEERLCSLFVKSAKAEPDGKTRLENELVKLLEAAKKGELPFTADEVARGIDEWREGGLRAIHHSARFRAAHHPAYRVIRTEFLENIL